MKITLPSKIAELTPNPKNPRKISAWQQQAMQKSLDNHGDLSGIIWNQKTQRLIGGHQRIALFKELNPEIHYYAKELVPQDSIASGYVDLGKARVPYRVVDWPEGKESLAVIAANQHSGDWEMKMLADSILEIDNGAIDMDLTGFSPDELAAMMTLPGEKEALPDSLNEMDDNLAFKLDSKLGDLYELTSEDGKRTHRVFCGDSTDPETVKTLLNGDRPMLMVTDPPYGVSYDAEWRDKSSLGVGNRSKGKVLNDERIDWSEAYSLIGANSVYVWHADKFSEEVSASIKKCDYEIVSQIIWAKLNFAISRGDYHWKHEPCWYAVKKGKKHNWQGARDQTTLWEISNLEKEGDEAKWGHSTQKPIECMAKPIRNNTAPGELVADPFLGSGTSLIAAEALKRPCYGLELNPPYVDIIINRFLKQYPKSKVLKNGKALVLLKVAQKIEDKEDDKDSA